MIIFIFKYFNRIQQQNRPSYAFSKAPGIFLIVLFPNIFYAAQADDLRRDSARISQNNNRVIWQNLSSEKGDFTIPGSNPDQTAAVVFDINNDGINDFVIGGRRGTNQSVVWYEHTGGGWQLHIIDNNPLPIEASGTSHDIDGDGDLDLILGGDSSSKELWWWQNPYPNFTAPWTRRLIKTGGGSQHHDQLIGDFDGDGRAELVYWVNRDKGLFFAEIPADPTLQPWPATRIFTHPGSQPEGLAKADIDGDGLTDIISAGYWFKHVSGSTFQANAIDPSMSFTRVEAAQLIAGGRPEVVFDSGDGIGPLRLYQWNGASWSGSDLLAVDSRYGHSLNIGDIDRDGHLDIFSAEMILDNQGLSEATMRVLYGDSAGSFDLKIIEQGIGNHESKLADLDGDGDLDILGKPFREGAPGIHVWLNGGVNRLGFWARHVADASVPWRTIFVEHGDIDRDGLQDIISGGWWWKNPGQPGGSWARNTIGSPLNQMAAVADFDNDNDLDVIGTEATGSASNNSFRWGRNDGAGNFTIFGNIENAVGTFLQGTTVAQFQPGVTQVVLSWQNAIGGIQMFTVPPPASISTATWTRTVPGPAGEGEGVSNGDIDRDGDRDLMLGTQWLRNDGAGSWTPVALANPAEGDPDRNVLVDMDRDGDLDVVIGFGHDIEGKIAWYEQPANPAALWTEHLIDMIAPATAQSVDVADIDGDGDADVVVGEHSNPDIGGMRLLIYENRNLSWIAHEVYAGDEHHDGAQLVDLDKDGDLDIISIGWTHRNLLIYENLSR
jgi:hypothetical protein